MVGLSEKAKGKKRAVEPIGPLEEGSSTPSHRSLTIRFTDGFPDVLLSVGAKDTVRDVKLQIRQVCPHLAKRRLRLIYSGRLLADGVVLLDWIALQEKKMQKSQEAEDGDTAEHGHTMPGRSVAPAWLHCSVGAELAEGDEEPDEEGTQKSQIRPLRGFDRLAAAGFSEEDIANFRRTFHSQTTGDYLDMEPLAEDEDFDEHARQLEEQWIESLDDPGSASLGQSSHSTTILQGLLVGFFFPLLPFFFMRGARPAVFWENGAIPERENNVVFSKRMQIALVLGFAINMTFGLWRYLLGS